MATKSALVHLQALRGLAALLVVFHHIVHARTYADSPLPDSEFGRLGVLIFFVISGFIMVYSSSDADPGRFLLRRLIRIVPLYWLLTLAFFALGLPKDLAAGDPLRRIDELAASLVFLPHWHSAVTTQIWPVLVQGWTLNFEMFFYLLFATGLALGRPLAVTGLALLALAGLGLVLDPQSAVLTVYTSPLLLLFAAGMLLAKMWDRMGDALKRFWPLLPLSAVGVVIASLGLVDPGEGADIAGWPSAGGLGWTVLAYLSATGVVLGTLALDRRPWPAAMRGKGFALLLGDASYAIYLVHTMVLMIALPVLVALPVQGLPGFVVIVTLGIALSTTAGILLHLLVERPVTQVLRRSLAPQPGFSPG